MSGTVKSYDLETGEGLIAVKGGECSVPVDLAGSDGVWLAVGMQVEFQMIHRPDGIFASHVRVI